MMFGVSGIMNSSGEGGGAGAGAEGHESGGASGGSSEVGGGATSIHGGFSEEDKAAAVAAAARMEESERSVGGNRWPRQETMALIKIRSDMAVAFRDSSLKGPLWEEVSRKMAELGFERTAKKCKEKFENLYKYHKRTKEGRAAKADGKTYRFFDQLEALESNAPQPPPMARPQPQPLSMVVPPNPPPVLPVSISSPNPINVAQNTSQVGNNLTTSSLFQPSQPLPPPPVQMPPTTMNPTTAATTTSYPHQGHNFQPSNAVFSNSSSSSTSSDEDIQRRHGRKRKWKDFFEKLMKDVMDKQEELQKKFLETLEKRERDRMAKEEAWRMQEMVRLNREHDRLVQERSNAAAKDAAVIQFLQKISEQHNLQIPISNLYSNTNPNANANAPQTPMSTPMAIQVQENPPPPQPSTAPPQPPPSTTTPPPQPPAPLQTPTPTPGAPAQALVPASKALETPRTDNNGGESFLPVSSSRWPKAEVQALIDLRTSLDIKYQENGPKGPLWEEISAAMAKLGYNRNAKRCKEKWENINKYFKKVKESNKKRPEDSKTCPYFHQLDALYRERAKSDASSNPGFLMKPDNPMMPIMARPEQQWPLPQGQHLHQHHEDHGSENVDENDDHEDDDEDEDDDEGGNYEIVTNKQQSSTTNTNTLE